MQQIDISLKDLLCEDGTSILLQICRKKDGNYLNKGYHVLDILYYFNSYSIAGNQSICVVYKSKLNNGKTCYTTYNPKIDQETSAILDIESENEFRNILYHLVMYVPFLPDDSILSHKNEISRFELYFCQERLDEIKEFDSSPKINIYDISKFDKEKIMYRHIIDFVGLEYCIVVTC